MRASVTREGMALQRQQLHAEVVQARARHDNLVWIAVLRLRELLWNADFEFAEFLSALAGIAWGFVVLLPADTFGSSPGFRLMAAMAPEGLWGLVVCAGGVQALGALLYGGRRWRTGAVLLGFATWVYLTYLFFNANPAGTAIAIFPLFALAAAWASLRLAARRGGRWIRS